MTNKHLIRNWRSIGIQFKSTKEISTLSDLFLVCVGESEIDVGGTKELVVGFFQGYDEKGSPAVFFQSDTRDRCWTFGYDTKNETHIKSNIGTFITELPERKKKKKNKKMELTDDEDDV